MAWGGSGARLRYLWCWVRLGLGSGLGSEYESQVQSGFRRCGHGENPVPGISGCWGPLPAPPQGGGGCCPQRSHAHTNPLVLAGYLAMLLASGTACTNMYRRVSDCVLKLGESMATYGEEDSMELQGLHRVCG